MKRTSFRKDLALLRAKITPCCNCKAVPVLKEPAKKVGALYWTLEHPPHTDTCPVQFRLRSEHCDPNDCVYEWNVFNKGHPKTFSDKTFLAKMVKGFGIEKHGVRFGFVGSPKRPKFVEYWKTAVPAKEGWYWIRYRGKRGLVVCPCYVRWSAKDGYYMISAASNDFFCGKLTGKKDRCIGFKIGAMLKVPPADPPKLRKDIVPARI